MTLPRASRLSPVFAATALLACACQLLSVPVIRATPEDSLGPTPTTRSSDATLTPGASPTAWPPLPTLTASPEGDSAALLPEFASDQAQAGATRYTIEASVDFDPPSNRARILGQARILYTVPLGPPIDEVPLMLWPNDLQYAAHMQVGPALIDGVQVEGETGLDGVVRRFRLPQAARAGEVVDLSLPFEIDARGPIGGPRPRRFGITDDVLIAPTFYPLVPRRIDGEWQVEPATYGGDTTNSDTAFYQVSLTVPEGLALAASGVEAATTSAGDGTKTVEFVSGPVRDFAFALGPLELRQATIDGTLVRAWSLPEHAEVSEEMLEAAAAQLALLNEWVGSYPYTELDVVDAPGAFGGIEYPGLVYIGTLGTPWLVEPTVHEVAHQWFYGLIGDDQLFEPWLDEALATYMSVLYFEEAGPPGVAAGMISYYRQAIRSVPDSTLPIGMAVADYASQEEYAVFVYQKGALFLDALRGEIGEGAFRRFLADYFAEYRFGFATGDDFQAAAEAACDCDLDPLFDLWVWEGGEIPGL